MVDIVQFHRPADRRWGFRRRSVQLATLVMFGAVLAAGLVIATPQAASAESTFDRPASPLIEMQVDADGNEFWQVSVTADSAYIATWERTEGVWLSADEAMAQVTAIAQCRIDAKLAYISLFGTHDEFRASPTTIITPKANSDSYTWTTEDATTVAAYLACADVSEWDTTQTTSATTDQPGQAIINIPADQMGPGTHDLFVADVQYPDSDSAAGGCGYEWPTGGWAGYGCLPTFTSEEMTVAVAYPATQNTVLAAPEVEESSAFDSTVFSGLPVMADGGVASTPSGSILPPVGPLLITIALTLVFAILIALPSALLESTVEGNESRISGFLRRLLPVRRSAPSSSGADDPSGSAAPTNVSPGSEG